MNKKIWTKASLIAIMFLSVISCTQETETVAKDKLTEKENVEEKKPKLDVPVSDHRFRADSILSGRKTLLILNRADVPIGEFTDFYLKVEGVEPVNVTISTDTKQGLVSKNKEQFYFGVKGSEGAQKIDLQIFITEGDDRSAIGTITIPTELNK